MLLASSRSRAGSPNDVEDELINRQDARLSVEEDIDDDELEEEELDEGELEEEELDEEQDKDGSEGFEAEGRTHDEYDVDDDENIEDGDLVILF